MKSLPLLGLLAFLTVHDLSAAPDAKAAVPAPAAGPANPSPTADQGQMFVEDGQLLSHPFTVFVTSELEYDKEPTLQFSGSHRVTSPGPLETNVFKAKWVVPHQRRILTIDGTEISFEGTVLVFDLSQQHLPWYKAATRLLPVVTWNGPAAPAGQSQEHVQLVAQQEVYIGNIVGAAFWTLATLGTVVFFIEGWSVKESGKIHRFTPRPLLLLITGPDGYFSLWRAQLVVWTLAVGGVVFLFGTMRLRVPDIPETLVALMGMSLLTGTVSAGQAQTSASKSGAPGADRGSLEPTSPPLNQPHEATPTLRTQRRSHKAPLRFNQGPALFADLISSWNEASQQVELSIPKAQMVFWTAVILTLFIVKSVLLGGLWPVPWQMVALTGMSQAGYIGDKYIKSM